MTSTTERALALRQEHPDIRASVIARTLGVSRERVRQILYRAGLPTHFVKQDGCPVCGLKRSYYSKRRCMDCRIRATPKIERSCGWCGTSVVRKASCWRNGQEPKVLFCTKQHQGFWAGKYHGFAAHPENKKQLKTHCIRGHPLVEDNLYHFKRGRACKACSKGRHARERLGS